MHKIWTAAVFAAVCASSALAGDNDQKICAVESWCNDTCLAAGTQIQMADGHARKVEDVLQGQNVSAPVVARELAAFSPSAFHTVFNLKKLEAARVMETTILPLNGKAMLELQVASGQVLQATENHPIITESGVRTMGELKVGDRVYTTAGVSPVTQIKVVAYQGQVYNLAVKGASAPEAKTFGVFYANGILVGDLNVQRAVTPR